MIVILTSDAAPLVTDADRFDRLHVEGPAPLDALELGSWVTRSDAADHVWLDIDELRALGRSASVEPGFDAAFDAMIEFAGRHGWLDDSATRVLAHVVG